VQAFVAATAAGHEQDQGNVAAETGWIWDDTYKRYFYLAADGVITWQEGQGQYP
jgi:hypothetical protein